MSEMARFEKLTERLYRLRARFPDHLPLPLTGEEVKRLSQVFSGVPLEDGALIIRLEPTDLTLLEIIVARAEWFLDHAEPS